MNAITELPPEIVNLKNLEELYLTRNGIVLMPRGIDKCTNLHLLILSDNAIDPKEKERLRNALPQARVQF
jgi:Leucine-rich repeat (LRR) protein